MTKIKSKLAQCENCDYKWETVSKKDYVTCPNCMRKTKVKNEHRTNR